MMIANWGDLRNKNPVKHITDAIKITLYHDGYPENWLKSDPEKIIGMLEDILVLAQHFPVYSFLLSLRFSG